MSASAASTDPLEEIDTLMCLTVGVPTRMALPLLLPDEERDMVLSRHGVSTNFPLKTTDAIVLLCRTVPTPDAYDTQGGVVRDISGQELLLSDQLRWKVMPSYKKQLKSLCKRYGVALDQVLVVDQTVRMRRLRGKCHFQDKVLIYVIRNKTTPDSCMFAVWMDASYSETLPSQHGLDINTDRTFQARSEAASQLHRALKKQCDVCTKEARHMCSACKAVYYCSTRCQKENWKKHKQQCERKTNE